MAKRGRLHRLTWLASSIVGGAAILTLGGPSGFIVRIVHAPFGTDEPTSYLLLILELAVFTCCTAYVVEGLLRRVDAGLHVGLADMLAIGLAAGLMVLVLMNEHRLWLAAQKEYQKECSEAVSHFQWSSGYGGPPERPLVDSILGIPLLFGLWCVCYAATWSGLQAMKFVHSWVCTVRRGGRSTPKVNKP